MRTVLLLILLLGPIAIPASALEIQAPSVPDTAEELMPEDVSSFGDALKELINNALIKIHPDLEDASKVSLSVTASVMLISIVRSLSGKGAFAADLAAALLTAAPVFTSTNAMIGLAIQTIEEMSEYGKLLLPVMTAALAAQGGATTSAALYTGSAAFNMILCSIICNLFIPLVYVYICFSFAGAALGEDILKKLKDFVKWIVSWCLKTILTIFTAYMSITGVVSGSTDAAALKAAKLTISSVVPVVGGILSDASEAILVSARLLKNAAGIYGILAILAVYLGPFLRIGIHYILLKLTAGICCLFGTKRTTGLVEDFSIAMGLLLAMTGAVCLLLLISTVCFINIYVIK